MRRFVLAVFALLLAAPAFAQSYPDRPVRIIVPTPAGGPVDVMARLVAPRCRPRSGRTSSSRTSRAPAISSAPRSRPTPPPDGYTLMVSAASGLIMSPMIYTNAGLRRRRASRRSR